MAKKKGKPAEIEEEIEYVSRTELKREAQEFHQLGTEISKMGKNVSIHNPILNNTDDSFKHGVLGDILSSSQTKNGVTKILNWLENYI